MQGARERTRRGRGPRRPACQRGADKGRALPCVAAALLALPLAALASPPDLTASLTYLCNPNKSRWPGGAAADTNACTITSLHPYNGKLYVAGGCWDPNKGPVSIFAVDPGTGAYTTEYAAGTERIDYFRTGADGRLYVPGLDQCEWHGNNGAYFRRDLDGTWRNLKNIPVGNITDLGDLAYEGFAIHTWDLVCWKGRVFTAGYGLAYGPEGSDEEMVNATPDLKTCWRSFTYTDDAGRQWFTSSYRRFHAFLPFADDLFCFTANRSPSEAFDRYDFEEWRFNEETGVFDCTMAPWRDIAPDVTATDRAFAGGEYIVLANPTPFRDRVLYIVGPESMYSPRPWFLCSAANENHHVKATRVDFGTGVLPFGLTVHDGVVTVVAGQLDTADGRIVNSVWESADGLAFRKVFSFKANQQASAVAYLDGCYYFGMGYRRATGWNLADTEDVVGSLYRVKYTAPPYRPVALGPALAAVKENGAKAVLSVTVPCLDAASASLALTFNGAAVQAWERVAEGETYTFEVATEKGGSYTFAFTATPSDGEAVVASGAFTASAVEGWFAVDFDDPGYRDGPDWTDLAHVSNPGGAWEADAASAHVAAAGGAAGHVWLWGSAGVTYTPDAPSAAGADVVVTGRVAVSACAALPATDDGMAASLAFRLVDGVIVPYGLADGAWHALAAPAAPLEPGQWVTYGITLDLTSAAAPRLLYSLDGAGLAWLPLAAAPAQVRSVGYRGDGGVGSLGGAWTAVLAELPVPAFGAGADGSGGGGLAFSRGADGSATFSATVANPVAGLWYTAFTATSLKEPFTAECDVQAAAGEETVTLSVDAGATSKFMVVVVSRTRFAAGAELPKEGR